MKLVILAQLHLCGSIYSHQIVAVGPSLPFARVCFWGPLWLGGTFKKCMAEKTRGRLQRQVALGRSARDVRGGK